MNKLFILALLALVFTTCILAQTVTLVRHTIKHNNIPKKMLFSEQGGNKNPWRIYELNGNYATFLSDTGSFDTGGQFACGLEKLNILQAGSKFAALVDYEHTIVEYYSEKTADEMDSSEMGDVMVECIKQYQNKHNLVEISDFDIKPSKSDVTFKEVGRGCLNTSSEDCAISIYNNACDSDKQCGGGMIVCKNDRCQSKSNSNSSNAIPATIALVVAIIASLIM